MEEKAIPAGKKKEGGGFTDLNRDGSSQLLPRATQGDFLSRLKTTIAKNSLVPDFPFPLTPRNKILPRGSHRLRPALALTAFGAIDFLADGAST